MTYVAAADLRERTRKPWAAGLVLGEADGSDADLDNIIAIVTSRLELELNDDFEPPNPDNDEIIDVDGTGTYTLYLPRRTRSLTTVKTRDDLGNLTTQASTTYRLSSSLNAAGTAMLNGAKLDELVALNLSTVCWPLGIATIQLTGKFGWAAVPDDIKRLVALDVYNIVKATADPLSTITQRTTVDAIILEGDSRERGNIVTSYRREGVLVG